MEVKKILYATGDSKLDDALSAELEDLHPGKYSNEGSAMYKEIVINKLSASKADIVIVSDLLPGTQSSLELIYSIKQFFNNVRIIFLTKYDDNASGRLTQLIVYGVYDFLASDTWNIDEIVSLILNPRSFNDIKTFAPIPKDNVDKTNLVANHVDEMQRELANSATRRGIEVNRNELTALHKKNDEDRIIKPMSEAAVFEQGERIGEHPTLVRPIGSIRQSAKPKVQQAVQTEPKDVKLEIKQDTSVKTSTNFINPFGVENVENVNNIKEEKENPVVQKQEDNVIIDPFAIPKKKSVTPIVMQKETDDDAIQKPITKEELKNINNDEIDKLKEEVKRLQDELSKKPKTVEIVKEVVKEVPKEIIKEIPKEIIKEVPVEIIKEVIKEVPAKVTKKESVKMNDKDVLGNLLNQLSKEDILKLLGSALADSNTTKNNKINDDEEEVEFSCTIGNNGEINSIKNGEIKKITPVNLLSDYKNIAFLLTNNAESVAPINMAYYLATNDAKVNVAYVDLNKKSVVDFVCEKFENKNNCSYGKYLLPKKTHVKGNVDIIKTNKSPNEMLDLLKKYDHVVWSVNSLDDLKQIKKHDEKMVSYYSMYQDFIQFELLKDVKDKFEFDYVMLDRALNEHLSYKTVYNTLGIKCVRGLDTTVTISSTYKNKSILTTKSTLSEAVNNVYKDLIDTLTSKEDEVAELEEE